MKQHHRLITVVGLATLAFSPWIAGCKKIQKPVEKETAGEFSPVTLGLPADATSLGPDPMGRYWYHAPDSEETLWVYDPKTKALYDASKDRKTGEWVLKEKQEVTAASLGFAADTVELGKDRNGLYWFEAGEKRFAYNTTNKTLYNVRKDAAGNWELGSPVKKP